MTTHPDTQAILLLCASFGQNRLTEPQPLTLREYNTLVTWLIEQDMTPGDLLDSTLQKRLSQMVIAKLDSTRLINLLQRGLMMSLALEKWTSRGIWVIGRGEANYPKRLKQNLKKSAPVIIYGIGSSSLISLGGLAIIGSRDVDAEGMDFTQKVAHICAQEKIQVISGGARGVDKTAMLAALERGGNVMGILADSLLSTSLKKEYRSAIQEGKLTLISTYDPDASFSIGNAMGRNKYIYALADSALVVSAAVETGGTWSGAMEALTKIKDMPIFVRVGETVLEGNQQLIKHGAKAFPVLPLTSSLRDILIDISPEVKPVSQSSKNIYDLVLPLILEHLNQPQTLKSLAELLQVRQVQMGDWLDRAIGEGKVRKNKKPVSYEINHQNTLIMVKTT